MRKKLFLWAALALFVIIGCNHDEIMNEKPIAANGRKITLTASMPGEASQTRISLEQETGTKNITVKWKAGDIVRFFFKQSAVLVAGTPITLNETDITQEGKKAAFTIDVPTEIDDQSAFTVYCLHGAEASVNSGGGEINVNVSPVGFNLMSELADVPIAGKVEVAAGASVGSIPLAHLGVLHCLAISNSSEEDLVVTPSLYFETAADAWFYMPDETQVPYYGLIGEEVQFVIETAPEPSAVTVPAGSSVQLVQWIMPNTSAAPQIWLKTQPTGGVTSANSKPARSTALVKGRAYHLYALWNGTTLKFTDDTFIPPLEIDDLTLTGDLMHADDGSDFIGVVYNKGDGKVYYNAAQTGGTWAGETYLGNGSEARVAIDGNGHPHVVFTTANKKIAYLKHNGTAWSDPVNIESNGAGDCSKADIAVDASGYAHITYTDTKGSADDMWDRDDIMYAVNSAGDFVRTLIYHGYYENWGGSDYVGHYYNKGSFITLDGGGNYYIITHQEDFYKFGYADRYYNVVITSGTGASGGADSSSSDQHDIYDLVFTGADILALYKNANVNCTATIAVTGTAASFTDPQSIATAVAPHVLSATSSATAIAGLAGSNLFTKYNAVENIDTDVAVKGGTRVAAVNVGSLFYSVYTDNADSKIKIKRIDMPI